MKALSQSFRWSLLLFALILSACASVEPSIEGMNHAVVGEFSEAVEDYNRAIALDPYNIGDLHFSRANALRGMGEFGSAVYGYQIAILYGFSPETWAYYGIALTYTDLECYQKAIESYERYIKQDDSFPPAYYNRGQLYLRQGDYAAAVADFEHAVHLDATYTVAQAALEETQNSQHAVEQPLQQGDLHSEWNTQQPAHCFNG